MEHVNEMKKDLKEIMTVLNRLIPVIALCGLVNFGFWRVLLAAKDIVSEYTRWMMIVSADMCFISGLVCVMCVVGILVADVFTYALPSKEDVVVVIKK